MPRTLSDDAKTIVGSNLREARGRTHLSQTQAADKAGIRRDRLNRWETGRELPGVEGLLILAVAYGCPIDAFLGAVDEEYDAIIERRIPVDVQQHYQAKIDTFIRRTTAAMQLALEPTAPAATRAQTTDATDAAFDKSGLLHARQARRKKTETPRKKRAR
jgi:transcriptional regulator with XRE-family HTH domain